MKGLLISLTVGLLAACQPNATDQTASPPANAKKSVDAVRNAAEVIADRMKLDIPGETRAKPVPDSLGPKPISFDTVSASEIKAEVASGNHLDTLLDGRCLRVWTPEIHCPYLLFRVSARDTIWQRFYLEDEILYGGDNCQLEVSTFDWDGRPPLEIKIDATSGIHGGSGGGSDYKAIYIFSPGRTPQQLLKLKIADTNEMAGNGLEKVSLNEIYTGCTRTLAVHAHEIVVLPIKTIGNTKMEECTLTRLPAGRYRYQNGKVFCVK